MAKSLNMKWTKRAKTAEDKKHVKELIGGSYEILKLLEDILEKEYLSPKLNSLLIGQEEGKDFVVTQSTKIGYINAIKDIIGLISVK